MVRLAEVDWNETMGADIEKIPYANLHEDEATRSHLTLASAHTEITPMTLICSYYLPLFAISSTASSCNISRTYASPISLDFDEALSKARNKTNSPTVGNDI